MAGKYQSWVSTNITSDLFHQPISVYLDESQTQDGMRNIDVHLGDAREVPRADEDWNRLG